MISHRPHTPTQSGGVSGAPPNNTTGWQPAKRPPESVQRGIGSPQQANMREASDQSNIWAPAPAENPTRCAFLHQSICCPLALTQQHVAEEAASRHRETRHGQHLSWSPRCVHRGITRILLALRQLPGPALQRPCPVLGYPLLYSLESFGPTVDERFQVHTRSSRLLRFL